MNQRALTLQMKNYRRFAETEVIIFQPGLTIISGPNGAGKSTLIEAFLYALFGLKDKRHPNDIRTDSLTGPVHVECKLYIDGQEVSILRSGSRAELRINGVIQIQGASGGNALSARMITLLGGLTREQFERTYIALQGDTAGLVTEKARERRGVIEKVLQLDVLIKAIELQVKSFDVKKGEVLSLWRTICDALSLAAEDRESLQSFKNARSSQTRAQHGQRFLRRIAQVVTEQRQRLQDAEKEIFTAQSLESERKKLYKAHQSTADGAHKMYNQQVELEKRYQEYQKKIANIEGKLDLSQQDIQRYQRLLEEAEQCTEASARYEQLQEEIEKLKKRLDRIPLIKNCYTAFIDAQTALQAFDDQLSGLANIDEELRQAKEHALQTRQSMDAVSQNDPTLKDYVAWQMQNGQLHHEEQQNREALELLEKGTEDARCPTCDQRFTSHSAEQRVQHLLHWLQETLPPLQEQLQAQKCLLDAQKSLWSQEIQQAEKLYHQYQETVTAIEKKMVKRDLLHEQRKSAHTHLLEKQNIWLTLAEGIPDTQEEVSLQQMLANLVVQAEALKGQADAYALLPLHQKNLGEKQKEQERLVLEKQTFLAQQDTLGFDEAAFQVAQDTLEQLRERERELLEKVYEASNVVKDAQSLKSYEEAQVKAIQENYSRFNAYLRECFREESLYEHLEEFKKHFFQANTADVMRRTTELLMYAITDQSILGVKFDKDEFQYLDARHTAYSIARLSSGEKALVGLCLRIALAEQAQTIAKMGRVKFLVLDEVLSSLDEERSEAVKRIFADVLHRGIFEHIIMITHLDMVKQSWHTDGLVVQKLDSKISAVVSATSGRFPV